MEPRDVSSTPARLLDPLNDAQRRAVQHVEGPLLVVAGPGSGKTRVITHRIAHLVSLGVGPENILAITFTNKAAGEMRKRVADLLGVVTPWISTFHSFAARILRRHMYRIEPFTTAFTIYDSDDTLGLVKSCMKELDITTRLVSARQVQSDISRMKNRGVEDFEVDLPGADLRTRIVRQVYGRYVRCLEERNALDFDDLLIFLERLLKSQPDLLERYRDQFRFVLIDEYQDTNEIQYRIGHILSAGHRNLCVTGDPDQSIYSWRGADIANILSFERDYPDATVVKLEQNYRSTRAILNVANNLIQNNEHRPEKHLWTENESGDPVQVCCFRSSDEEVTEIADLIENLRTEGARASDLAVFYRINALSRELERALILRGIPYTVVGSVEFFQRREIKDLIAYLRLLANPRDTESLARVINVPPRRIGKTTFARILAATADTGQPALEVLLDEKLLERSLGARAASRVSAFVDIYEELRALPRCPVRELLRRILDRTEYEDHLKKSSPEDWQDRLANVRELVNAAQQFDERDSDTETGLQGFLEETALLSAVDRWDSSVDRVSLMSLHSAKGLEFPAVVILGVEDGLLPLVRAGDESEQDIEEERRLLYVGLTRARERLYLTHARSRYRFGSQFPSMPSSFLRELDGNGEPESLDMDDETREILERLSRPLFEEDHDAAGRWRPGRRRPPEDHCEAEALEFSVDDWDDDVLDEDPYPAGARVMHDIYGEGVVVASRGSGRRRRLVVEFESVGQKTIVPGHAPLRRIR